MEKMTLNTPVLLVVVGETPIVFLDKSIVVQEANGNMGLLQVINLNGHS